MSPEKKNVSRQQIANRAYELWEARDRPRGDGVEDWLTAERELLLSNLFARWCSPVQRKAA